MNNLVFMWCLVVVVWLLFCGKVESATCSDLRQCESQTFQDGATYNLCYAELSCLNTIFIPTVTHGSTYDVQCLADYSCVNGTAYNITRFLAHGYYAMKDFTVYNYDTSMYGYVRGYYGGLNLTVYCYDSSTCTINCYGNACTDVTLICDGTSNCNFAGSSSYEATNDNEPQYYRNFHAGIEVSEMASYVQGSSNYRNNIYCETSYACYFDSQTIAIYSSSNDYIESNIYCIGSGGCYYTTITITIGNDYHALSLINVNESIVASSTIYCTAYQSCSYGSIYAIYNDSSIGDDYNVTLVCGGYESCTSMTISGVNQIYGLNFWAFANSKIISDNHDINVYISAIDAAIGANGVSENAMLYCNYTDVCTVYCDNYNSCYYLKMYCYGTCIVHCDSSSVGSCPFVYDLTRQPTSMPTHPTNNPTIDPTPGPSAPTLNPTEIPSFKPTSYPVTTTTSNDTSTTLYETTAAQDINGGGSGAGINSENENLNGLIGGWEIGGYITLIASLTIPIILFLFSHYYHKKEEFYGCDKPNYMALFAAFWNLGDLYSDLMFTMILVLKGNALWYFSICFSIVPHFASNFISVYSIGKWQNNSVYIAKYIDRYDWLIVALSCVAGFYAAIELIRSNLFYLSAFSLQLKTEDYHRVQNFRLFNTIVFENMPQIIVQVVYISQIGTIDVFVFSAMLFSTFSAFVSVFQAVSRRMQDGEYSGSNGKYYYRVKKTYKMKIECEKLRDCHKYTHKTIGNTICGVLGIDEGSRNIEVFYIVPIRHAIIAYVEVSNISFADQNSSTPSDHFFSKMLDIGKEGGSMNEAFKEEFSEKLHLELEARLSTVQAQSEPGRFNTIVGKNMIVTVVETKHGLSPNNDLVDIQSMSPSGQNSGAMAASGGMKFDNNNNNDDNNIGNNIGNNGFSGGMATNNNMMNTSGIRITAPSGLIGKDGFSSTMSTNGQMGAGFGFVPQAQGQGQSNNHSPMAMTNVSNFPTINTNYNGGMNMGNGNGNVPMHLAMQYAAMQQSMQMQQALRSMQMQQQQQQQAQQMAAQMQLQMRMQQQQQPMGMQMGNQMYLAPNGNQNYNNYNSNSNSNIELGPIAAMGAHSNSNSHSNMSGMMMNNNVVPSQNHPQLNKVASISEGSYNNGFHD